EFCLVFRVSRHGQPWPLCLVRLRHQLPGGAAQCGAAVAGAPSLSAGRGAPSAPGGCAVNPQRKKRLFIVLGLLAGVGIAVALALVALQQNINLFYSPTQIANGEAPAHTRIRAGGMVAEGSVQRSAD